MSFISSIDASFLTTLQSWLGNQAEILVLIRYSRGAGSKSFEFFRSIAALSRKLAELPPRTSIVAFRKPLLPLRGLVDDQFVTDCLNQIPEDSEFLLVEKPFGTTVRTSWIHEAGESHAELRAALEHSRGTAVAVGLYPRWVEDDTDVISAIVPDEHGMVKAGVY